MRLLPLSLLTLGALSAQAAVLLQIDIRDPNAVIFTATGAYAGNDNSDFTVNDGITLVEFFTGSPLVESPTADSLLGILAANTLTAAGTTSAYNQWMADNSSNPELELDLNLYGGIGEDGSPIGTLNAVIAIDYQLFSTSAPAFSGAATFDLSTRLQYLPAAGASGQISPGYSESGTGASIGQWLVIPEPSTYALLIGAGALAATALRRRFRRS